MEMCSAALRISPHGWLNISALTAQSSIVKLPASMIWSTDVPRFAVPPTPMCLHRLRPAVPERQRPTDPATNRKKSTAEETAETRSRILYLDHVEGDGTPARLAMPSLIG